MWEDYKLLLIISTLMHQNINIKFKNHAEKFSKTTGIEIQIQHWGGNRQLSMEGIAVEYLPSSIYPGNNKENINSIHI